jgi:hypothetical protein
MLVGMALFSGGAALIEHLNKKPFEALADQSMRTLGESKDDKKGKTGQRTIEITFACDMAQHAAGASTGELSIQENGVSVATLFSVLSLLYPKVATLLKSGQARLLVRGGVVDVNDASQMVRDGDNVVMFA